MILLTILFLCFDAYKNFDFHIDDLKVFINLSYYGHFFVLTLVF